jgi:hypothetical protein
MLSLFRLNDYATLSKEFPPLVLGFCNRKHGIRTNSGAYANLGDGLSGSSTHQRNATLGETKRILPSLETFVMQPPSVAKSLSRSVRPPNKRRGEAKLAGCRLKGHSQRAKPRRCLFRQGTVNAQGGCPTASSAWALIRQSPFAEKRSMALRAAKSQGKNSMYRSEGNRLANEELVGRRRRIDILAATQRQERMRQASSNDKDRS